jgi:protein-disulfide isomerase
MSRSPLPFLLLCLFAVACAATPPVPTVSAPAAAPTAQVATAGAAEAARAEDEPFVEDADPGPVPILARDPWWGRRDALVTIVEFSDFQCPFCRRVNDTLAELRRTYGPDKLRIVWKNLPLSFHKNAAPAALLSARVFERFGNKAFWEVHDAFFDEQRDLDRLVAEQAARLGLSAAEMKDLVDNANEHPQIAAYRDAAEKAGASGTPAFFINGVFLSGAQPIDKFTDIIDQQLGKAEALVAHGTPRARVYAALAKAQWTPRPPPAAPDVAKDDTTVWAVPIGKSPVRGPATALVTIVEFSDFQCPFCNRAAATIQQILAKYGPEVRFVFKHNPLPFHPKAGPAATLALEARAQRGDAGFWRAHDMLFGGDCQGNAPAKDRAECEAQNGHWNSHQTQLDPQDLQHYASMLGLDVQRVTAALTGRTHDVEIEEDQGLADDLEANGTPHFFINGRRFVGAQPLTKFVTVIDEELAKARALVKGGVKPAQIYARILASGKSAPLPEKRTVPPPTRDNPARGPANAKVVVQFWSDFQCPFCARVAPTIEALEKAFPGKIRIVWRNLPLPMHPQAEPAAEAAMEAFRQKGDAGFWAMYELLYAAQAQSGSLERPALERYAAQLGLDMGRFASALDTNAHRAVIDADAKAASDAGISGTPAFVINGYLVSGAQPLAKFKKVVALALAGK